MTTLADPLPGGRPGEVERATALAAELAGRGCTGSSWPTSTPRAWAG